MVKLRIGCNRTVQSSTGTQYRLCGEPIGHSNVNTQIGNCMIKEIKTSTSFQEFARTQALHKIDV